MVLNKYLVFGGDSYYPMGGAYDYIGSTSNPDSAMELAKNYVNEDLMNHWSNVFDTNIEEIIFEDRQNIRPEYIEKRRVEDEERYKIRNTKEVDERAKDPSPGGVLATYNIKMSDVLKGANDG